MRDKTHVLRKANFFRAFKISVFSSRRDVEILSRKIPFVLVPLDVCKALIKRNKTVRKATFPSYVVPRL